MQTTEEIANLRSETTSKDPLVFPPHPRFLRGKGESKRVDRNEEARRRERRRECMMPILRWEENLPRIGRSAGASFNLAALGGISSWEPKRRWHRGQAASQRSVAVSSRVSGGGLEQRLVSQRSVAVASRAFGGGVE
ncbi:hypothetical protein ACJRO7_012588 [Eucalyptus globulus]|uniref:Uncharacterized protein n=1 Tax=Eucalyptus globulus TaxID=34317 RepID=A0ABD3LME8_EUCGL